MPQPVEMRSRPTLRFDLLCSVYPAFYALLVCLALSVSGLAAYAAPQAAVVQPPPFESEIAAFEAADKINPPPKGAVLFVGSSSIRLWTTLPKDFPELTVINRGFGGSTIADNVRYAPRIVLPYKPKTIVFYAGTNDIDKGEPPSQVFDDFREFVRMVHSALPGTRIVYISINPSTLRWSEEGSFIETNRLISAYIHDNDGKMGKLSFIDTHSRLLGTDGKPLPGIFRPDGLHLNSRGYALWTAAIKPQLLSLVAGDSRSAE